MLHFLVLDSAHLMRPLSLQTVMVHAVETIVVGGRLRARTAPRAFRLRAVRGRHFKIRTLLRSSGPVGPAALPAQLVGAIGPDTNRT